MDSSSSDDDANPRVEGMDDYVPDTVVPGPSRSGVLFSGTAGVCEDETPGRRASLRLQATDDQIFPVNKPPNQKWRVGTTRTAQGRQTPKTPKKPTPLNGATEASGVAGMAINPCQLPRPIGSRGTDLLDDRIVADIDELYDENEKALSSFVRLHPMLSLDATSERILSKVALMIDDISIDVKEVEVVGKSHDDVFLRPAKPELGERACCNDEKCICRWSAIFRHGEESPNAFVCREYLLPSQEALFQESGELPKTNGKCLLCTRYYTSYIYTLARNSPSFCPTTSIQIQAFCNRLVCERPVDAAPSHASSIGDADGYRASVMLFVDEKWAESSSSRNGISALLWRPTVRFNCRDYNFVVDSDGTPRCIQVNMGIEAQDFGLPPN